MRRDPQEADVAVDQFLQFVGATSTGISAVGESLDKAHPQTIAVNSVEFGVENPTTIGTASGGAGAGKATFESFKVSKLVDSASPALFQSLTTGSHFPVMKLFVRRAGATTPSDYAIYEFRMVFITKIDVSGAAGEDALQETVEMVYGAMQMTYATMTATGTIAKQQVAIWNQVTNTNKLDMPLM
jgi:type VI secretion system secreted protein Hcp